MIERITTFLQHQQYSVQNTNFANLKILYKPESNQISVVVVFDMDREPKFTIDQFQHILEQVNTAYYKKGYTRVELLSLLCTEYTEAMRPYCHWANYTSWIVDIRENRLLVFENQPQTFGNLRNQLEGLLIGPLHRANPEFQEKVHVKSNYFDRNPFTNAGYRNSFKWRLRGIPICTIILVLINALIFLLMKLTETDVRIPSIFGYITDPNAELQHFLNWGATSYVDIVENHQYFRLFTALFLHADSDHLINNMLSLAVIGYMLETHFGSIRFLIIYFVAGVLANVGSVFYFHEIGTATVGLGASGAIFGIIGGFAFLVFRYRGSNFGISGRRFALFLFITVYSGFQAQGDVDNIAHIVGFFIGVLTSIVIDNIYRNRRIG